MVFKQNRKPNDKDHRKIEFFLGGDLKFNSNMKRKKRANEWIENSKWARENETWTERNHENIFLFFYEWNIFKLSKFNVRVGINQRYEHVTEWIKT